MTIRIEHVITIVVGVVTVGAIISIAIWNAHRGTHGEINKKIDGLVKDLAEYARIAWIEGRTYQYAADLRERDKQDAADRERLHSLERIESLNKKEG